jgi:glycosyltransferase involved in cell wall biosynthesis
MKILLLTGHFPPEKSGGIGRPFSLYKYLPQNEIEVIIVTKNLFGKLADEKDVFRYGTFWNWRETPMLSKKVLLKLLSFLKNSVYGINTDGWWTNEVIRSIDEFSKEDGIEAIYATFPGPDVLEAALKIKEKLQIPLIVEFRDGLAFETVLKKPNFLQRNAIKNLERRIINASDAVVTIGENLSKYFRQTYTKPVYTVYNGYDETDFDSISDNKTEKKNKKQLVHFGSLNSSRTVKRKGLFKALKSLKDKKIIDENNFSLLFIGNITDDEKERISEYKLDAIISFLPQMHKKEGFSFIQKQADYLLFYGVPNQTTIISSKLLEYIKLGKPIIGICKGNEAELIIEKTGTGEVCDFDQQSIENLLMKVVKDEIFFKPEISEIEKFNRKEQSKEIAGIIRNVLNSSENK